MNVKLDFKGIKSKAELHDYLSKSFELPSYYGRNLDGLYDILSEEIDQMTIELINLDELEESLGHYGRSFLRTLEELSSEYSNIVLKSHK